jgi:hypothetical protein
MNTFGKSWKTTLAGIIAGLGGLGTLTAQIGIQDTKVGHIVTAISSLAMTIGLVFGFSQAKDKNVTGAGKDAETVASGK